MQSPEAAGFLKIEGLKLNSLKLLGVRESTLALREIKAHMA